MPRASYAAAEEVEARLILERDFGDVRAAINPTLTKVWSTPEIAGGTLAELSAGTYYRRRWIAQPGIELFSSTGTLGA
jgi:hypothetical protein